MIGVYDATGTLGRLVTAWFDRLGVPTRLIGATQNALAGLTSSGSPHPTAVASVNDSAALERALDGCRVLVNCAPPRAAGERLVRAALDAGIQVTVVEKRMQARDHPVLLGVPETYYLKCFILRKLP